MSGFSTEFEALGRGIAEQEAQRQAEQAEKVAKVAAFLAQGTFPALWVKQQANVTYAKNNLRANPKSTKAKAALAVEEARTEALRDAAVTLTGLGRDIFTLWEALAVATEGLDFSEASAVLLAKHGYGFGR